MNALETSPRDYHTDLKFNKENIFDPNSFLSKSVLWSSFGISLWHWKNRLKPYESKAMQWGSVMDILTTTPEEADELIVAKEDCSSLGKNGSFSTNASKEWRDEHIKAGHFILDADQKAKALEHADILLNQHPVSSEIFADSKKQVMLHSRTKSGINLKGLADLVPSKDCLVDLKMCSDFTLAGFSKAVGKFGYHVQAGLYLIMWNKMNPNDQRERFKHIWQNPETGEVAVTELDREDILAGQAMTRYLISRLQNAYIESYFPMLTNQEDVIISRPPWSAVEEETILDGVAIQPIKGGAM